MGDLHSIAYNSSSLLHSSSSQGWDFHSLGVFNADMSHSMDSSSTPFFSPFDSDFSTGYLQDALFEFTGRSKRRRLLLFADNNIQSKELIDQPVDEGYWEPKHIQNCLGNFSYLSRMSGFNGVSEMKTPEEEISASEAFGSSSSSQVDSSVNTKFIPDKENLYSPHPISPSETGVENDKRKKRVVMKRVVYPFAVVKPGGFEGDMTLNDINERILMPPTRPVRHPVGDYACRPLVSSAHGQGLSGKAVVAFTRIHTQGRRGTITIIRTKG